MISFFPKEIANKGIALYFIALAVVSILFISHAMQIQYIILGIAEVVIFFVCTQIFSKEWKDLPQKQYIKKVFWWAVGIRVPWVIVSYLYFTAKTGTPFEFSAADAWAYHADAEWLCGEKWNVAMDYLFYSRSGISDSGYLLYLTALYKIIGPNIFLARVVKCIMSAFTGLLVYKLAARVLNENVGRIAGIFFTFMPNLILYCGMHLKETEMIFLIVAFLERTDYLLRSKKYNVLTIAVPSLIALSLFTFRTVLGAVAVLSFATAVVFTTTKVVGKKKRAMLIGWGLLVVLFFAGGSIVNEVESYWENRGLNQDVKRTQQMLRGNQWAKYATGTVMAPIMFVLPFPTMVDVDQQYNQQMLHGGNYVRNFLGIFVLIAMYVAIFKKKNWRDLSLIGSFVIGYLAVICMSGFAASERFLLPGLPILLIFAAFGVSELDTNSYRFAKYWYIVVPIMSIAWAYFKLGSRGLF